MQSLLEISLAHSPSDRLVVCYGTITAITVLVQGSISGGVRVHQWWFDGPSVVV